VFYFEPDIVNVFIERFDFNCFSFNGFFPEVPICGVDPFLKRDFPAFSINLDTGKNVCLFIVVLASSDDKIDSE
jgi:hypothetical protein